MSDSITLYQIETFLANLPEWSELGSKDQHRIKMDILGRMSQTSVFWTNAEAFCQNYVNWVKKYVLLFGSPFTNKTDMWETWSNMLRELYLHS